MHLKPRKNTQYGLKPSSSDNVRGIREEEKEKEKLKELAQGVSASAMMTHHYIQQYLHLHCCIVSLSTRD
jgi:hypothetical protein